MTNKGENGFGKADGRGKANDHRPPGTLFCGGWVPSQTRSDGGNNPSVGLAVFAKATRAVIFNTFNNPRPPDNATPPVPEGGGVEARVC